MARVDLPILPNMAEPEKGFPLVSFARAGTIATALLLPSSFVATPARALHRERITTTTLTLPAALEPATSSFHWWTQHTLAPRLYHEPLPDGRTIVVWTDAG